MEPVEPVDPVPEPVHPHPPPHHTSPPFTILPHPHPPVIPSFYHLKQRLESLLSQLEESHAKFEWIDCDGGQVVIRRYKQALTEC